MFLSGAILDGGGQHEGEGEPSVDYTQVEFSVSNWIGYPEEVPTATGPMRVVEGEEYRINRKLANRSNEKSHRDDPSLEGKHIHEIKPVKLGGSPTDPANKLAVSVDLHMRLNKWWAKLLKEITDTRKSP